jgi:hypothetical protein
LYLLSNGSGVHWRAGAATGAVGAGWFSFSFTKEKNMLEIDRDPVDHIPTITIDSDTADKMGGFSGGPTVARIVVDHQDDKETVFFVSVSINKVGHAVCEVATNVGDRGVRKSVRGFARSASSISRNIE